MRLNQVTIPCTDYDASVAFYKRLGLRQVVDSPPRYARFVSDSGASFSIHATETKPAESGFVVYFEVDDVDETVERLESRGLTFAEAPADQTWLWREAYLLDPSGNRLCIYHAGENRLNPPWKID